MNKVKEFLRLLPAHKASLRISHNSHKDCYETVKVYIEQIGTEEESKEEFVSDEEYRKSIDLDELWEIQYYPDTPVGFYRLRASSLEAILKYLEDNK